MRSGRRGRRFESCHLDQKETTIFGRRLSFLFVLFTFLFSFFSLLSNCRFQRKDKREEIKEKVALLRKALIWITNYDITHSKVSSNSYAKTAKYLFVIYEETKSVLNKNIKWYHILFLLIGAILAYLISLLHIHH